jgi:hypothetical protein
VDRLCYWLQHEDWWLHNAALASVSGLVADERFYQKLLPLIGKLIANNRNSNVMWSLHGIAGKLCEAPPAVQDQALQTLAQAYSDIPQKIVSPGGLVLATVESGVIDNLANSLAGYPNGFDKLYSLATKRYPDQSLPHKDLFMNADVSKLGPELKNKVSTIIRDQFIPEYVANNIPTLADVRPEPVVADRGQQGKVEGLAVLYSKMGVPDYNWQAFGPVWNEMQWDYFSFDPPEALTWNPGQIRYRKVTYPAGMENWFAADFDAKKAGWQTGLQPFGQENGKLRTEPKPFIDQMMNRAPRFRSPCATPYCRCCEPMKTFWDKEVLLMRGTFAIPPIKEGHRYRLVVGGMSCRNNGDGVRVYVNGRQVLESTTDQATWFYVDQEHLADFQGGKVTIAATGFLRVHKRSNNKGNFMAVWFEEMKLPPLGPEEIVKAAMAKPMLSSAWQALQDPGQPAEDRDLEAGKFKWDGKFVANKAVLGTWTTIVVVPTIDAFDPAKPIDAGRAPFKELTFKDGGLTDNPRWLWSGDTFLHMDSVGQALKMTAKKIDGADYLFVEAGGFDANAGKDWKAPLVVLKRK